MLFRTAINSLRKVAYDILMPPEGKMITESLEQPRCYPSATRNEGPILEVLKQFLGRSDKFKAFEIASGTGQHAKAFGSYFSCASWEPTEYDETLINDIELHCKSLKNVKTPQQVDIRENLEEWTFTPRYLAKYDVGLCVNMIHISPVECTHGLFRNMAKLLAIGGLLFTYGPYAVDGSITPQSNVDFNNSLKSRNPEWGIRDINFLKNISKEEGLKLEMVIEMPANNKTLVFRRLPPGSESDSDRQARLDKPTPPSNHVK